MTKTKIVLSLALLFFALPLSAKPPHDIHVSNSSGTVHFSIPSDIFAQTITPNFSIQFQQGGSNITGGFFNESPFNLNCSTNLTCTISGSTLTMVATGGGSGSPCVITPNSLQYNNAGAFGCVTQFTYSGSTVTGANGTLDLSGMTLVKLRFSAGLATTLNGDFGYDTIANRWHIWQNGADKFSIAASNVGASGQPCLSNADGSCTFSDPQVQGTQAPASTTIPNPVVSGGSDYGGTAAVRTQKIDASGNFYVALASAPTLTVNLPQQPFLNITDFNDVVSASPTRGDLIVANSTPKWARFAVGATNTLFHGGTDPSWSAVAQGDVTNGYWDTSSNQTALAGTKTMASGGVIIPATDPYYDIRKYGAKCDEVTDDTAAIQATITAAKQPNATAPATIFSPAGAPGGKFCVIAGQINCDGCVGLRFTGPSGYFPGVGGGRVVWQFTGSTAPLFSCSGCLAVTFTGMYFTISNAAFTGVAFEFGPLVSTQILIDGDNFEVPNGSSGVVDVSFNNTIDSEIARTGFGSIGPSGVYIRGALNTSSDTVATTIRGNEFNSADVAQNGTVYLQNFTQNTEVYDNDFELGAAGAGGAGPIVVNYTAGTWSGASQILNFNFHNNYVADASASSTNTLFTFPANCSGVKFATNSIAPTSSSVNVLNFGNNCKGISYENHGSNSGTIGATWFTLGTGNEISVRDNDWTNHTITAFMSGTPVSGSDVTDNAGVRTAYGSLTKFGQADIVADSAAINTTETIIVKTPAFPASRLIAGSHIRAILTGTCTSTVANTSTFTIRWGTNGTTADGSVAALVTSIAAASGTNNGFRAVIDLTVRTAGASATSSAFLQVTSDGNIGIVAVPNDKFIAGSAFNTTTASGILSVSYKSAATTTTSTFKNATIEMVQN